MRKEIENNVALHYKGMALRLYVYILPVLHKVAAGRSIFSRVYTHGLALFLIVPGDRIFLAASHI